MCALHLTDPDVAEIREVPVPTPAADQVLLKVGAAGICHSDLHLLHFPYKVREEPLTMGHEIAGTVVAVGSAVTDVPVGRRCAVYLCWSCGVCRECVSGNENVCLAAGRTAMPPCPGLGPDGGMAEYVAVPARSVVDLGDLPFTQAAPIADAGLTSMHAIAGVADHLRPGATARMVGLGGGVPGVSAEPAGDPGWPWGGSIRKSYGGTRRDLIDVIALARAGKVTAAVETFLLAQARPAFERLDAVRSEGGVLLP
ncbi:alcohol dehydrogenase catalytic domain-containing protein [Gordonia alkaliphila]